MCFFTISFLIVNYLSIEFNSIEKPYPMHTTYKALFKKKTKRICKLKVLFKSKLARLGRPKHITNWRIMEQIDFGPTSGNWTRKYVGKLFPFPKIKHTMLNIEGLMHASSWDINMGYHDIEFPSREKLICTVVLTWGKYEYQKLTMNLCNSSYIFQVKISKIFKSFEKVRTYIEN